LNVATRSGPASRESTVEENLEEIKAWEMATLHARSRAEQLSDWIAATAARGSVMMAHALWFGGGVALNVGLFPHVRPFDPFPFPFLTMVVSLEAIFLALFVLSSQNHLSRQGDKRSHLDLQIDLLSEREMTAMLQLLRDIATHLDVKTSVTPERLNELAGKTDIHKLTHRLEELTDNPSAAFDAAHPRHR